MLDTLKKLLFASGVSGNENEISAVIKKEISGYVDEAYNDVMGNLIAFKKGTASNPKKLMYAAHMDEIGFMVTYIESNGFLRVAKVGGINYYASAYSHVVFSSGVRGVLVPEARTDVKNFNPSVFCVDIGAKNETDARKKVKIGDYCRMEPCLNKLMHQIVSGRPIDNRIGCYILCEAIKQLKSCENDTYFVFTVQEEVGVRGSKTSAFNIKPDYAVAIDIGGSGDVPNSAPFAVKLSGGAAIKLKDGMVICHPAFVLIMKNLAEKYGIKYQLEILESGGTDTCSLQQAAGGSIAGAFSIPTRYGHSGVETIDMNDVDEIIKLTVKLCEYDLSKETQI